MTGQVEQWDDANRGIIMVASGRPYECNVWWQEIYKATSIAELEEPMPSWWDTLTLKVVNDLKHKIKVRPEFDRKVRITQKELQRQGKQWLNGRQLYWMLLQDLRVGPYDVSKKRQFDLIQIKMRGNNLERFNTEFVECLLKLPDEEIPSPAFLENLYSQEVEKHQGFYQTFQLYHLGIDQNGQEPNFDKLRDMVEKYLAREQQNYNSRQFQASQWQGGWAMPHLRADRKVLPKANAIRTTTQDDAPTQTAACSTTKQDKVWPSKVIGRARKAQRMAKAKARPLPAKAKETNLEPLEKSEVCHPQATPMPHHAGNGSPKVIVLPSSKRATANTLTRHSATTGHNLARDVMQTADAHLSTRTLTNLNDTSSKADAAPLEVEKEKKDPKERKEKAAKAKENGFIPKETLPKARPRASSKAKRAPKARKVAKDNGNLAKDQEPPQQPSPQPNQKQRPKPKPNTMPMSLLQDQAPPSRMEI